MKRYMSVFGMITRSSIYKILTVLGGLAVTELIMFCIGMEQPLAAMSSLEDLVDQSHYVYVLAIAYVLMTAVLCFYGCSIGSRQEYTLKRLRIKEKSIFLMQCFYNILCYVLLWGVQLLVLFISSRYYMEKQTEFIVGSQTLFMAFHRSDLMHGILPLHDWASWVVLVYVIAGTGIAAAGFTWKQRQGRFDWKLIVVMGIVFLAFPRGLGEGVEMVLTVMTTFFMLLAYVLLLQIGKRGDGT